VTFTPNAGAGPSRLFDRSCTEERETSSMLDHVLRGLIARPEPDVGLVVAGVELPAAQVVALRSAAVRPADAVLGLDVPARFGAVVATAPSLLRRSTRAHSDGVLGVAVARLRSTWPLPCGSIACWWTCPKDGSAPGLTRYCGVRSGSRPVRSIPMRLVSGWIERC